MDYSNRGLFKIYINIIYCHLIYYHILLFKFYIIKGAFKNLRIVKIKLVYLI